MRILGFEIVRKNGSILITKAVPSGLQSVNSSHWWNWGSVIHEPFTGAWQRNITADPQTSLLAFSAVFCAVTGIAADIAKLRIKLAEDEDGIWTEITKNQPWLPVLRKPNHFQNRIKFIEQWIVSKLLAGNTYVLKERDKRGIVNRMYVLDPQRVTVLVAPDGSVYYQLREDLLSQVSAENPDFDDSNPTVPASEIIHDMMVSLWHPLVGVSPLYACAVSATMGNRIQANSTSLFGNESRPGGTVTVPGAISQEAATRLKTQWETNYSGANVGRIAILSDGMKFEPVAYTADVMQLVEQLKWTVEDIGRAFHYPGYKMGGALPPYASSPEALTTMYYTDCLQPLIESLELCLDEGLELPQGTGTDLDLDGLMRMDTAALYTANNTGVSGGWMAPNEARYRANFKPADGGDSPLIQQQNYSLAALAKRDAQENPFAAAPAAKPEPAMPAPAEMPAAKELDELELKALFDEELRKELTFA